MSQGILFKMPLNLLGWVGHDGPKVEKAAPGYVKQLETYEKADHFVCGIGGNRCECLD